MKNKPYKQLRGQRVYLLYPQNKKTDIILSKEAQESLMEEEIKKMSHLQVYDVGDGITEEFNLKAGDMVLADVSSGRKFELNDEITVILISVHEVIHVW